MRLHPLLILPLDIGDDHAWYDFNITCRILEALLTDISIHQYLPDAQRYLLDAKPGGVPGWSAERAFTILPLAQGEYNMNFKVIQNEVTWVLRINTGSQMGLTLPEQITYEYRTLACLMPTGVAPIPYFLDNSCKRIPFGVLGM